MDKNGFEQSLQTILLNLNPIILVLWSSINIIIPVITLFYYFWQFEFYHPALWIFIPDSYTFAILFGIFIILTLGFKKNIQILNIITFIGLVKVFFGYITLFLLIPSFFDMVSLTAHSFEMIEGLTLLPFIRTDLQNFITSAGILILDWFMDFNPFILPTLALYPLHEQYNPNPTSPFIGIFFLVFSFLIFSLLIMIKFMRWNSSKTHVKWIENLHSTSY